MRAGRRVAALPEVPLGPSRLLRGGVRVAGDPLQAVREHLGRGLHRVAEVDVHLVRADRRAVAVQHGHPVVAVVGARLARLPRLHAVAADPRALVVVAQVEGLALMRTAERLRGDDGGEERAEDEQRDGRAAKSAMKSVVTMGSHRSTSSSSRRFASLRRRSRRLHGRAHAHLEGRRKANVATLGNERKRRACLRRGRESTPRRDLVDRSARTRR